MRHSRYKSIDERVAGLNNNLSRLNGRQYTDYAGYSYRLDRNNVDPEQEQVMLAANQIKYEGLINSLTSEFSNLQSVMK